MISLDVKMALACIWASLLLVLLISQSDIKLPTNAKIETIIIHWNKGVSVSLKNLRKTSTNPSVANAI